MRVKQLIEQLQRYDPEAEVLGLCCDDNPLAGDGFEIRRSIEINYSDKSEAIVYIDGTAD